jgi:type IV pilus assembly protein PilO
MNLADLFKRKSATERLAERGTKKNAETPKAPARPKIDFAKIADDFKSLDPKDPGLWPMAPKVVILLSLFSALVAAAWWFGWNVQLEELQRSEAEETRLKEDWVAKKKQAVNLEAHKAQLVQINNSFGVLLKQLPNQSEIGDLLVDINKAAQGRGLLVDLFRPGGEAPKGFYAEVPIALQVTGSYHDFGAFAGDIAQLPRIVTLNDLDIVSPKDGALIIKTTAKTFRYLDEDELARQRKAEQAKKAGKK